MENEVRLNSEEIELNCLALSGNLNLTIVLLHFLGLICILIQSHLQKSRQKGSSMASLGLYF